MDVRPPRWLRAPELFKRVSPRVLSLGNPSVLPSPGPLCFLTALATHTASGRPARQVAAPLGPAGIRNIFLSARFSSPVGFTTAPLTRVLLEHRGRPGGCLAGGRGSFQYPHTLSPAAGLALTFMGHTGGTHRHQKDHRDTAAGGGPPEPLAWLRPSSPAQSGS